MQYTKTNNTDMNLAKYGENSAGVLALQKDLNAKYSGQAGYTPLKEDGLYGDLTKGAVAGIGTKYGITPAKTTIVQDTSALRKQDTETGKKADEIINNYTGGTNNQNAGANAGQNGATVNSTNGEITGADGKIYKPNAPSGYKYSLPPLADGKKYVYDASGRPMVQNTDGSIANDPYADQQYEENKESIAEIAQYNADLDSYKTGLNASHQALIDATKEQFAIQKKKMEELNKRALGAKTVSGYRTTKTAEYAPEMNTDILTAEAKAGEDRLAEIESNMRLAIAQLESAKSAKDFELVQKRIATIQDLQKAKEESIENIYQLYVDNNKMLTDKIKAQETEDRASRDQALQELTVSAPELVKQYDSLKTDADRKNWLAIMVKKTGLDETILKGSLEKIRLDVANKESILNKRENPNSGGSGKKPINGGYTATELKKLRAYGIDPSDTNKADALLYKNIKPDDYEASKPRITADNLDISYVNKNVTDKAVKEIQQIQQDEVLLAKINLALEEGYEVEDIAENLGLAEFTVKALKDALKKNSNSELL